MRRFAVSASVLTFFALAIVGTLCGVSPFVCSIRAVAGAIVVLIVAKIASRLIIGVMVDTIVKESSEKNDIEDLAGGPANR